EGARRPIIDAHGEGSYGPAIGLGGQQNKGIAWRMRPIVGTIDGKQRHPAGAVGGVDGGEASEAAEGEAQAELPHGVLKAQEQRDQQLLGSMIDGDLGEDRGEFRGWRGHGWLPWVLKSTIRLPISLCGYGNAMLAGLARSGGELCDRRR